MRVLFALPGFHRTDRGAEIAFIAVANELARLGADVTLIGSGQPRPGTSYKFLHAGSLGREKFAGCPSLPFLRDDCGYEELTFVPQLLWRYRPADYDVTLTCSYPFTNWVLRRSDLRGHRPRHVFVTENGDWPAYANQSEYRFFSCDGLVCTNPDFYERNRARWRSKVIPNGIDCNRFSPGPDERAAFGLPHDRLVVLMVSALVASKFVDAGIESVCRIPDAHLVVAGTGPLRALLEAKAAKLLPGRFTLLSIPPDRMPTIYRSADVFLHLSKDEAFGNVYLEALACGLPIVAHDTTRVRWIVGDDQFLTALDEPAAIAGQIVAASKARTTNEAARLARAQSFSWTKIGPMYRDFLQEIVALPGTQ